MNKFTAAAICLTLACALAIPAHATTIVVTNTNDNGPGSLRQALVNANDGDTIDATGISGVITLTSGELLVDKSVTINAAGAKNWYSRCEYQDLHKRCYCKGRELFHPCDSQVAPL